MAIMGGGSLLMGKGEKEKLSMLARVGWESELEGRRERW